MLDHTNLFEAFEDRISPVIVIMPVSAADSGVTSTRVLTQDHLRLGIAGDEVRLVQGGFNDVSLRLPTFDCKDGLCVIHADEFEIRFLSSTATLEVARCFRENIREIFKQKGICPEHLAPRFRRPINWKPEYKYL
jgi:hypothetical protein